MEQYNKIIKYKRETGYIISIHVRPDIIEHAEEPDIDYLIVDVSENPLYSINYISNGKIEQRPELQLEDTINIKVDENYVFENIPSNTKVTIDDGFEVIIDEGSFDIDFPISGLFNLTIIPPFPYIEKNITVVVEDK